MSWLADLPFQRKLQFAILATSTVALMLACGVFLTIEYVGYRRNLVRTVETLARVAAHNSTAAVAFADSERARENLEALRAEPQIVAAALYQTDGTLVASYSTGAQNAAPALLNLTMGVHFENGRVIGVQPVIQESRWLGTLYVWATMDQVYRRMQVFALVILGVLGLSVVFAWMLSVVLQRTLARPVLELAKTAGAISIGQDFSLRARRYGRDELGRLTDAFNLMLDKTQAAVAALRSSEAQVRLVTDNAPVLLVHCDRDYRYKFVNRPSADRLGREPSDMVGRHIAEVMGAAAFESVRPHIDAALGGDRVEAELELPDAGLRTRWMQMVYVPERDRDGVVAGFVAVGTDVTERKRAEREVALARDEALAASRAKDEFLAALSHELRTPLSPVLLLASEAAEDPALPEGARSDFETIRKHVELEARLIDDLLDLTAVTRGKLTLEHRLVDVHTLLHDVITTVSSDIEAKRIDLTLDTAASRSLVVGDPVRLQQVFWNVLKNAVKFTPVTGTIHVETSIQAEADRVLVSVSDTGIGMTQGEIDRVFDIFSQGDHASEGGGHRFGGLGLGLAISRRVVELHEGSIRATSAGRGHGAMFLIELPLAHPETPSGGGDSPEKSSAVNARLLAEPGESARKRILLVEDHVPTRTALERLLAHRKFLVTSAGSLAEARACVDAAAFDLLLSDVGLPDGSGYELMQELVRRFRLPGIALTGYGMDQDVARSQAAGFSAHLTKPVRVQSLDQALEAVFKR